MILSVGLACLDVVHVVSSFPLEDSDQRGLDKYSSLGGNAANSAVVLTQMVGEACEYFGTLAEDTMELTIMEKDLKRLGVNYSHCPRLLADKDGESIICPNSCVIVSALTASRTIIHTSRNLPELTLEDFKSKIDLNLYDWVHFEGRNVDNVKLMIDHIRRNRSSVIVSVEVEKLGRRMEELILLADLVFVSRDFAVAHGAASKEDALRVFEGDLREGALLVCAWGESGAAGKDADGKVYSCPAFSPSVVVDTLGAGDTFNAAVIASLGNKKLCLEEALRVGCRVAGAKVGRKGFEGLGEVYREAVREGRR